MQAINLTELTQAGMQALHNGKFEIARSNFETIIDSELATIDIWGALAVVCQQQQDYAAMLNAANKVLELDPHNIHALILKGDYYDNQKNYRAAAAHYSLAVRLTQNFASIPNELTREIQRITQLQKNYVDLFRQYIETQLAQSGYRPESSSQRFTHSLALLFGQKLRPPVQQQFTQEPHAYFFPELPTIQFYPRFEWADEVEAATNDIISELANLLESGDENFAPYIQSNSQKTIKTKTQLLDSNDWSSCSLIKDGVANQKLVDACPKTMAALANVPLTDTTSILFSQLKPGAKIPPHSGLFNTRLICHLPLIVPKGCIFRVGNESRHWEKGKVWTFDDSINHEAVNTSNETRIILIFDIWRPELSEEERILVSALIRALNAYK